MHASLMRKRLTLGDLLIFMNWDRETLWNKIWKDCANSQMSRLSLRNVLNWFDVRGVRLVRGFLSSTA